MYAFDSRYRTASIRLYRLLHLENFAFIASFFTYAGRCQVQRKLHPIDVGSPLKIFLVTAGRTKDNRALPSSTHANKIDLTPFAYGESLKIYGCIAFGTGTMLSGMVPVQTSQMCNTHQSQEVSETTSWHDCRMKCACYTAHMKACEILSLTVGCWDMSKVDNPFTP
jgi:hypothetical protein